LFLSEFFKLHGVYLLPREELEKALELPGIDSPIDVSKTTRFGWRRAGNARFLFSHGIEEIQRLAALEPLHVPVRKCALDGIAQQNEQLDFRIVIPNPFGCWLVVNVTWRAITGDG